MNLSRLKGEIIAVYGTQKAFAEAIGWHKNKVSKMICGRYKPNTDEVSAISDKLHLTETQFCNIFLT
jgi:DNA-binding helix-turn-helix protein